MSHEFSPFACVQHTQWRVVIAWLLAVIAVPPFAAASTPPSVSSEIQDLMYLAPKAPIFLRLRVRLYGKGIRSQREEYATQLFKSTDVSGDGVISGTELANVPAAAHMAPVRDDGAAPSVSGVPEADADGDNQITHEEFVAYILAAAGAPFHVNTQVQQSGGDQPAQLFDRMDRNNDGRLAPDELNKAPRRLRLLDYNLDGRISADEIRQPDIFGNVSQNQNPAAGQASTALTLLQPINSGLVDDALARRIQKKYDKLARSPKTRRFVRDGKLTAKELGQTADHIAVHDQNGDGALDRQELQAFLQDPPPSAEIKVVFDGDKKTAGAKLLKQSELSESAPIQVWQNGDDDVTIQLGSISFQLTLNSERRQVRAAGFRNAFDNSDRDKNEYLDRDEFRRIGGLPAGHFSLVDTDGDGMVVKSEFTSFATLQAELQKHVVSLSLVADNKSLFTIVDVSGDGFLDDTELNDVASRIHSIDHDDDGSLSTGELGGQLTLVMSQGNTRPVGTSSFVSDVRTAYSTLKRQQQGSGWFTSMDRNGNGTVERVEFLGPLEVFKQIDTDNNSMLTAAEVKEHASGN